MNSILLIEDDPDITDLIKINIEDIPSVIKSTPFGKEGINLASDEKFDLIILDIMLPDIDGLEVCRTLRMRKIMTPVMMLTSRSEEIDKITGLETGADDYLTKPFSIRELKARVKAILRRAEIKSGEKETAMPTLQCGKLILDPGKRKLTVDGIKKELTPKEFDLLYMLMKNPGRSYSREALLQTIWGYDFSGYEHTVNSHINRLRGKVEIDSNNPQYILTVWGVGYSFTEDIKVNEIS